jgi:hypothetical protein
MATYVPFFLDRSFNDTGTPLAGGLLYTYAAGTGNTAQLPTYQDPAGTIPFTNPIVLNAGGFPTNGSGNPVPIIWLPSGVAYKFILTDSLSNVIWENDNYSSGSGIVGFTTNLVTDLRGIIGSGAGQPVFVDGVTLVGDGGQGWWYWDAASTAADDLGIVIKPTPNSGAGRWLRFVVDKVNVKWYGAKGDGTNDDYQAFSSAQSAALSLIVPMYAPVGSYKLRTDPGITVSPIILDTHAVLVAMGFSMNLCPIIADKGKHFDIVTGGTGTAYHFVQANTYYSAYNNAIVQDVFPEWFGAWGDNALDDSAAIQAAIYSVSGAVVRLTAPLYHTLIGLNYTSNLTVIGNGSNGIRSADANVFVGINAASNVLFKDFTVQATSYPIVIGNGTGDNIVIDNVKEVNTSFGFLVGYATTRLKINRCKTAGRISVTDCPGAVITNNSYANLYLLGSSPFCNVKDNVTTGTVSISATSSMTSLGNSNGGTSTAIVETVPRWLRFRVSAADIQIGNQCYSKKLFYLPSGCMIADAIMVNYNSWSGGGVSWVAISLGFGVWYSADGYYGTPTGYDDIISCYTPITYLQGYRFPGNNRHLAYGNVYVGYPIVCTVQTDVNLNTVVAGAVDIFVQVVQLPVNNYPYC